MSERIVFEAVALYAVDSLVARVSGRHVQIEIPVCGEVRMKCDSQKTALTAQFGTSGCYFFDVSVGADEQEGTGAFGDEHSAVGEKSEIPGYIEIFSDDGNGFVVLRLVSGRRVRRRVRLF